MLEGSESTEVCPRCGYYRLMPWKELDDEQRFLVERLAASAEWTPEERKRHRYCTRCWFENVGGDKMAA
jgi:hypothetical protein